ncbi:GntR family transcriptional regulator [Giesbergeria sinuosa]|uniref:GntR family transcriptional regulator n=1 Tax=Giesbergeria sinuosa TaxID=80883 RepID=A0ABV9QBE8_9BURK
MSELLAERLRERILRHEFMPGTDMDEVALLKEYGVSRTPVREALKLLHHEGLLTAKHRRGMAVTVLSETEVHEAREMFDSLNRYAQYHPTYMHFPRSLLRQMLSMVEQRLRLAYGLEFDSLRRGTETAAVPPPTNLHESQ